MVFGNILSKHYDVSCLAGHSVLCEVTSNISWCMCPMTGFAPASKIRAGTLEGPGPNIWRSGTAKGFFRHFGGGMETDNIVGWCAEFWKTTKTWVSS